MTRIRKRNRKPTPLNWLIWFAMFSAIVPIAGSNESRQDEPWFTVGVVEEQPE